MLGPCEVLSEADCAAWLRAARGRSGSMEGVYLCRQRFTASSWCTHTFSCRAHGRLSCPDDLALFLRALVATCALPSTLENARLMPQGMGTCSPAERLAT